MHVIFVSACEKKAIKKTRTVLDSYAMRRSQTSWHTPITEDGLKEVKSALNKVATRQTAVAAYRNYGNRGMKLVWVVGARYKFGSDGAYPIASTKRKTEKLSLAPWVRTASLLAGAAGYVHDIGKASVHFQNKLKPENANRIIKDEVRHEWLSIKLLQKLRHNGWNWQEAWKGMDQNIAQFSLGDRADASMDFIGNDIEAVDYLVVSHHGLLGHDGAFPNADRHVRTQGLITPSQIECAGEIRPEVFKAYQNTMKRLEKHLPPKEQQSALYWKALMLYARVALIFADHTVSAQTYEDSNSESQTEGLFANTKIDKKRKKRKLDQPLDWHLVNVGERARFIASKMTMDLNLTGLSEQTVEFICRNTLNKHFKWQNTVAKVIEKYINKHPDISSLVFNIAGTGSGKTRLNLRVACTLSPENPRIAIAQNLRSLTLQTGEALKSSMNLGDEEITTVIGDKVTQKLFEARDQSFVDTDENPNEPMFDVFGEESVLPTWLDPLFQKGEKTDHQSKAVLSSPILVSTIDYLVAAGEPHRQGHHVKALLRLLSSDLILDEIDSYEPSSLMAVLRLVQLAALYGRNVICSSATLSDTVAKSIYRAFESGIEMREALHQTPQKFLVAIADNELKPEVWIQSKQTQKDFISVYHHHLEQLQEVLTEKAKTPYRLAQFGSIEEISVAGWKNTVLAQIQALHQTHQWQYNKTGKQISFGLIRVANIKHAIDLAKFLVEHLPHAKVACYHANDWLISRFYKEQSLDQLLTRPKTIGNQNILADNNIKKIMSEHDDVPFIVIATPVEEVGRDHDFDWGIIDASSAQSIVQTAGRINRHRLIPVNVPNISILQHNYRYCESKQKNQNNRYVVFKWPGYEAYSDTESYEGLYRKQNLKDLLPWNEDKQLVIDARLRFDKKNCLFAKEDDQQIEQYIKKYFYPEGKQVFSNTQVKTRLLTEKLYQDTPLRSMRRQEVYFFEYTSDGFETYKQIDDGRLEYNPKTDRYQPKQNEKVIFNTIPLLPNSWLAKTPEQLVELCDHYGIEPQEGCRVSLAVYQDEDVKWTYDYSFGIYRT